MADRAKVGADAEVVWCEEVDGDVAAVEAVPRCIGARELDLELECFESRDDPGQHRGAGSQIGEYINVTRHARGHPSLLERAEIDHQASDEGPASGLHFGEVEKRVPKPALGSTRLR